MSRYIHASAVLAGEHAVLISGPSGSGKSALVLALLKLAGQHSWFARLIGDDRVSVTLRDGRLIVRGHPAIAGRLENRGCGIVDLPFEAAGVVAIAVELAGRKTTAGASAAALPHGARLIHLKFPPNTSPEQRAQAVLAALQPREGQLNGE